MESSGSVTSNVLFMLGWCIRVLGRVYVVRCCICVLTTNTNLCLLPLLLVFWAVSSFIEILQMLDVRFLCVY